MTDDSSPRHSVSVAAAVVNDAGQVLVVRRRDTGAWEPPGGVLELGETIEEGLVREVREEAGLLVQPEALTGVYKHMRRGIIALVFRCRSVGGEMATSEETSAVTWMTPAEILEHMSEAFAARLLDALKPGPAAVRAHDGVQLLSLGSQ